MMITTGHSIHSTRWGLLRAGSLAWGGAALLALPLAVGCGSAAEDDDVGQLSVLLTTSAPESVPAIRYAVVAAGDSCDATPLAETTVAVRNPPAPDSVLLAGAGENHSFSDNLFVLEPGDYRVCATPLDAAGASSTVCAAAESNASVAATLTTRVVLVLPCDGAPTGGLDTVVVLNEPPRIERVITTPTPSASKCTSVELVAEASDVNEDALTYSWSLIEAPAGSTAFITPGAEGAATLQPDGSGNYEVRVEVSDVYDASTSLVFPVLVSAEQCTRTLSFGEVTQTEERGSTNVTPLIVDRCPAGQALVGMDGFADALVRGAQAVCGVVRIDEDDQVLVGPGTTLPFRGDGSGKAWERRCPPNQMVVGFTGRAVSAVDQLVLRCAGLSVVGGELVLGAASELEPVGDLGGVPFPAVDCTGGQVATATGMRQALQLDAFSLGCSTPSL